MYKPKHFDIEELFHPSFIVPGENPLSLRPDIIWKKLDELREAWGKPLWINGNGLTYAGVRPLDSKVGAPRSRHKIIHPEQAFDLHGKDVHETKELTAWIQKYGWRVGWVGRMEDPSYTNSWVHIETFPTEQPQLIIFKP